MNISIIAGARPNFMKVAPIIKSIEKAQLKGIPIQYRLIHTGQHYDKAMSGDFFDQLGIPQPHVNLACGGGSQAEQTAAIMVKIEQELLQHKPELLIVVGDVTSTMACTITAKKLCIDVAHVEAGIRSGDMTMPEEINRMVTDAICDLFFTTSTTANMHLINQGVNQNNIHFVGNTMIDTLLQQLPNISAPDFFESKLTPKEYYLLTLHRPSNVDDPVKLGNILSAIADAANDSQVVFPVHPRTQQMLDKMNYQSNKLILTGPQGYQQFIYLVKNAKGIITDSGGITEEATVMHVPCLTMRNSTERPETITIGTNELIGDDILKLAAAIQKIQNGEWKKGEVPPLWDGQTADRIIDVLINKYCNQ